MQQHATFKDLAMTRVAALNVTTCCLEHGADIPGIEGTGACLENGSIKVGHRHKEKVGSIPKIPLSPTFYLS